MPRVRLAIFWADAQAVQNTPLQNDSFCFAKRKPNDLENCFNDIHTYIFVWNSSDFCWKNAKILSVYLASECDSRLGYYDYSFLAVFLLKNALIFEWHAAFFDSRCLLAQGPCLPMLPVVFTREFFLLHWPCVVYYFFSHFLYTKRLIGILAADLFLWVISSGFSLKSSIPWSISMLNKLYLIFKLRSLMSLIMCLDSWAWCQAKIDEMAHYYSCLKALFICLVWRV